MIYKKALGLLLIGLLITHTTPAYADVPVKGYYRDDGTYVKPHYRSNPDGNFSNNWSTKGNINPYTGEEGTKTHPDSYTGSEGIQTYPNYSSGYEYIQPTESVPFEEIQRRAEEKAAESLKEIQEKSNATKAFEEIQKNANESMEKYYEENGYNPQISAPNIEPVPFEEIQKIAKKTMEKYYEENEHNPQISVPNIDTEAFEEIQKGVTEDFIKQQNEIMKKYEGNHQKQQEEIDKLLKELEESGNYTPPVISDISRNTKTQSSTNIQDTEYYESVDSVSEDISNENQVSVPDKPSFWDKFINFIKGLFS